MWSNWAKAVLMPDPWDSFGLIEAVATVVEPDFTDGRVTAGESELRHFERVVSAPPTAKLLELGKAGNLDRTAHQVALAIRWHGAIKLQ